MPDPPVRKNEEQKREKNTKAKNKRFPRQINHAVIWLLLDWRIENQNIRRTIVVKAMIAALYLRRSGMVNSPPRPMGVPTDRADDTGDIAHVQIDARDRFRGYQRPIWQPDDLSQRNLVARFVRSLATVLIFGAAHILGVLERELNCCWRNFWGICWASAIVSTETKPASLRLASPIPGFSEKPGISRFDILEDVS
jgi:hypothetical protein